MTQIRENDENLLETYSTLIMNEVELVWQISE